MIPTLQQSNQVKSNHPRHSRMDNWPGMHDISRESKRYVTERIYIQALIEPILKKNKTPPLPSPPLPSHPILTPARFLQTRLETFCSLGTQTHRHRAHATAKQRAVSAPAESNCTQQTCTHTQFNRKLHTEKNNNMENLLRYNTMILKNYCYLVVHPYKAARPANIQIINGLTRPTPQT